MGYFQFVTFYCTHFYILLHPLNDTWYYKPIIDAIGIRSTFFSHRKQNGPPEFAGEPLGSLLSCRVDWVDPEGLALLFFTFRLRNLVSPRVTEEESKRSAAMH